MTFNRKLFNALHPPVKRPRIVTTYTVFMQEVSGLGATYIQAYRARTVQGACNQAFKTVARDWNCPRSRLRILGVARGYVQILDWNDLGFMDRC